MKSPVRSALDPISKAGGAEIGRRHDLIDVPVGVPQRFVNVSLARRRQYGIHEVLDVLMLRCGGSQR